MTHSRFLELKPAMAAFERDKKVEHSLDGTGWCITEDPQWYDDYYYRPCPKPKVKRWRPWTVDEIPLGNEVRNKSGTERAIIIIAAEGSGQYLLDYYTLADGTPCGVEEECEAAND